MRRDNRTWLLAAMVLLLLGLVVGGATYLVLGDADVSATAGDTAAVLDRERSRGMVRGDAHSDESVPRVDAPAAVEDTSDDAVEPEPPTKEEEAEVPLTDADRVRAAWSNTPVEEVDPTLLWPPAPVAPAERGADEPARTSHHARSRFVGVDGATLATELPAARLLVRVFSAEDGEPLPDASVEVFTAPPPGKADRVRRFAERVLLGREFVNLDEGALEVIVRHTGRVPVRRTDLIARPGRELVLDVYMELGVALRIHARHRERYSSRGPAAGVRVRLWPSVIWWESYPHADPPDTLLTAVTDERGMALIDAVPRHLDFVQVRDGGGWAWRRTEVNYGPDTRELTVPIDCSRAGSVKGVVTDARGEPVQGAEVFWMKANRMDENCVLEPHDLRPRVVEDIGTTLRALSYAERWQSVRHAARRVTTDALGRYAFHGQDQDWQDVWFALHPVEGRSGLVRHWGVRDADSIDLRLRGRAVTRLQLLQADGTPVSGAEITVPTDEEPQPLQDLGDGSYGPFDHPVGLFVVWVDHPDHRKMHFVGELEGDETHVVCQFEPTVPLKGIVLDADGHPQAGATVTVALQEGVSDAEGNFEVKGLWDREYPVLAEAPDHLEWWKWIESPHAPLRIELERELQSAIHLVVPDGAPTPAWMRWAMVPAPEGWEQGRLYFDLQARIDWDDGQLTVGEIPERGGTVYVRVPGYRLVTYRPRFVDWLQVPQVDEIPLVPAPLITGRVLDDLDRPVKGASVEVRASGPHEDLDELVRRGAVSTDAEGVFAGELAVGGQDRGWVVVQADGFVLSAFRIADEGKAPIEDEVAPEVPCTLTLRRGHWVEGRVQPEGTSPQPGAVVSWEEGRTYADEQGRFRMFVPIPVELTGSLSLGGQTIRGTVELEELPTSLEPLVIEMR